MLRILVFMMALGASGATAWFLIGMKPRPAEPAPQVVQVPMEEILVASSDLSPGVILGENHFQWRSWPASAVDTSFIRRGAKPDVEATLKGSLVSGRFAAGEPIREDKLIPGSSGLLASILPQGKRAVAIRVSAESTAGGFILPNNRVDVIQTISSPTEGQRGSVSYTLLSNIRVLAVDQKAVESKEQSVIGKTVTLELDPKQSEILASAQASGGLSLALRSALDMNEVPVASNNSPVKIVRGGRVELVRAQE